MSQFKWTVTGNRGKNFNVGLYHGSSSGHVLVHCNRRIVLIDFNVRETKTYSFFLDDELCELTIERAGDQFLYGLQINREADTPLNRVRRRLEKKHLFQTLAFFSFFAVVVIAFAVGFSRYHSQRSGPSSHELLASRGSMTTARVWQEEPLGSWMVSFVSGGQARTFRSDSNWLSACPVPVVSGDEFLLRYLPGNPAVHTVVFDSLPPGQLERFLMRVADRSQTIHPDWGREKSICRASIAYELTGMSGLADLYFQDVSETENPLHNQATYRSLTERPAFREKEWKYCD